jgi:hypothetical protein
MTARPFCFMSQFWGRRYREYFVDYCLPSLLAADNLPRLRAEEGHCFLIATPREDWEQIVNLPVVQRLQAFATPILIETPAARESSYVAVLRHQTFSLKRLFEAAYASNAFGCAVWPDTIMSNGFVAAMQRWVEAGHHLVMQPTVRLAEEGVLGDLKAMKLLPDERRLALTGEPLAVPPRVVASLSVRHPHPDLKIMEEGHPQEPLYPPYRFWRVPNRNGLVLHVFFATPVLMDFAAVPPDHSACLEHSDWESVYIGRNFSACGRLYVVADSDESGILSITPSAVQQTARITPRFGARLMPHYALLCNLRGAIARYTRGEHDLVRRDMFRVSVRWHADDIDEAWRQEEARISGLIERAAGDYYAHGSRLPPRINLDLRYLPLDLANVLQNAVRILHSGFGLIFGALGGNREDLAIVRQKLNMVRIRLIRRLRLR